LNNVDKSEKYPYECWFQSENLNDTYTYELTKKSGLQKLDVITSQFLKLVQTYSSLIIYFYAVSKNFGRK